MLLKSLALLLAPLPLVLGQYGGGTTATSAATATQSASAAVAGVHVVEAGEGSLVFTPNVTTAAVGEKVEFHFYGPVHSVVEGSFDNACAPLSATAFFSGGISFNGTGESPTTFTITINDTQPIFFYCGVPKHCQLGMVGVINPSATNTTQTLDLYKAAALLTTNTTRPAGVAGGVLGPAASSSTPSTTSSSAPAATSSKASDATFSRGQVGWMGVVSAGVVAWGLALLMG